MVSAVCRAFGDALAEVFVPEDIYGVVEFAKIIGNVIFLVEFENEGIIHGVVVPCSSSWLDVRVGESPAGVTSCSIIVGVSTVNMRAGRFVFISGPVGVVVMRIGHSSNLLIFVCNLKGEVSSALDTVVVLEEWIEVIKCVSIRVSVIRVVEVRTDHTSMHHLLTTLTARVSRDDFIFKTSNCHLSVQRRHASHAGVDAQVLRVFKKRGEERNMLSYCLLSDVLSEGEDANMVSISHLSDHFREFIK